VGDGAGASPPDRRSPPRPRRAVELGVTLIDTADAYGPEIAERLIGEALAPYAGWPQGLTTVIATKGGITRQGPAKTEYVGRAGYLISVCRDEPASAQAGAHRPLQLHRIDPRTPLEESWSVEEDAGTGQDPAQSA